MITALLAAGSLTCAVSAAQVQDIVSQAAKWQLSEAGAFESVETRHGTVEGCSLAALLSAVRGAAKKRSVQAGAHLVSESFGLLELDHKALWQIEDALKGATPEVSLAGVRLLSFVGPFLSYEESLVGFFAGAGFPQGGQRWITLDTRSAKPADVLALADEASLLDALAHDSIVRAVLTGDEPAAKVPEVKALDALQLLLDGADADLGFVPHDLRHSFAIHAWDPVHGLVALRFAAIHHLPASGLTELAQIGLWAKAKPGFHAALHAAGAGKGLFFAGKR